MTPKLDDDGWPLEWQMLEAKDMCRGEIQQGQRCCASGWISKLITDSVNVDRNIFTMEEYVIRAAKLLRLKAGASHLSSNVRVVAINDSPANSLAMLARALNLAAAMAGYVEDNDEAETLRKMEEK